MVVDDRMEVPLGGAINFWPPLNVVLVSTLGRSGVSGVAPYGLVMLSYGEQPVILIAMNRERKSLANIKATGDFVVNIPGDGLTERVIAAADKCGPEVDKFEKSGFTPIPSLKVSSPSVKECPVNYECTFMKTEEHVDRVIVFGRVVAMRVQAELAGKEPAEAKEATRPLYYGRVLEGANKFYSLGRVVGQRISQ